MKTDSRHPDPQLIALGVQQPWAELIVRGIKTLEVRSQPTQVRGTIYIYASRKLSTLAAAEPAINEHDLQIETLPTGLLVGTVEIVGCRPYQPKDAAAACLSEEPLRDYFAWELSSPLRLPKPLPVRFLPYGVWFYPFRRKNDPTSQRRAPASP